MKIHTNNRPRLVIDAYQLTEKDRAEFDWLDWQAIDAGNDNAQFIRYKKRLYCLDEFMRCSEHWSDHHGWHGYKSDSYFSGILVKFSDQDHVVIGQYFC